VNAVKNRLVIPRFTVIAAVFVVFCMAIGAWLWKSAACHNGNPPLHTFYVAINLTQKEQVIQTFEQFAKDNGFGFAIAYYTPNHEEFAVALTRRDTEIDAANGPYGLEKYVVTFYNNDCIHPTTASDMDSLVSALKGAVSHIPGAKVTTEP
jgi:hypothetical protein